MTGSFRPRHQERMVFDGRRTPGSGRTSGSRTASSPRSASCGIRRRPGDRRDRAARGAGLRRHPHALRRPDLLGPVVHDLGLARGHVGGDRQLRVRVRRSHPEMRDRTMLSMTRNEAVPLVCMQDGMPWDWVTFPEFLDSVERTPKSVNVLPYMGLTPLIIWVMGMDARKPGSIPTDAEHAEMQRLLHEAMDAGACGWSVQIAWATTSTSSSTSTAHPWSRPTSCTTKPRLELASVLGERSAGFIDDARAVNTDDYMHDRAQVESWAAASGRPVVWNAVFIYSEDAGVHRDMLGWLRSCRERGLQVIGQASRHRGTDGLHARGLEPLGQRDRVARGADGHLRGAPGQRQGAAGAAEGVSAEARRYRAHREARAGRDVHPRVQALRGQAVRRDHPGDGQGPHGPVPRHRDRRRAADGHPLRPARGSGFLVAGADRRPVPHAGSVRRRRAHQVHHLRPLPDRVPHQVRARQRLDLPGGRPTGASPPTRRSPRASRTAGSCARARRPTSSSTTTRTSRSCPTRSCATIRVANGGACNARGTATCSSTGA